MDKQEWEEWERQTGITKQEWEEVTGGRWTPNQVALFERALDEGLEKVMIPDDQLVDFTEYLLSSQQRVFKKLREAGGKHAIDADRLERMYINLVESAREQDEKARDFLRLFAEKAPPSD